MAQPNIKTALGVVPMIYAYTTPEIARHNGWIKIGYTEQDVDKRIQEQTHTADVEYHEEWRGNAIYDDGSGECFQDHDFHRYLRKYGIENNGVKNEWFKVSSSDSRRMFYDFRQNRGAIFSDNGEVQAYVLRTEQKEAVQQAENYAQTHQEGEFLWNAKPRFGKTLAAYDLCRQMGTRKILIVTNRPAIATSWYDDYEKFLGTDSGLLFVSNVDTLAGRKLVHSREDYLKEIEGDVFSDYGCIEFVSLQDLKGARRFGGQYDKLSEVADLEWDVLIVDEAHEGVDTSKTDTVFRHIKRKFTLHLSGTPFKALANDKFASDAIYNWTYVDEQKAKAEWKGEPGDTNPYEILPQLNMLTYQMSQAVVDKVRQGIDLDGDGEAEEYAFDLSEFFLTNGSGKFIHDAAVDNFLDALTTQTRFPFSTAELRDELRHTFWLLNRVDSAKALAVKLEKHPVFKDYKIILAAGDGKKAVAGDCQETDDDNDTKLKAFDRVTQAIRENDKTITLSVGQLTTGVTVPEWTAVLMLCSLSSPALYMQAAFRAQNPCMFRRGNGFYRKRNAYVFDFDPARTLIIYEEFANGLSGDTSGGGGDSETRKAHVKELLNFFPVLGEDENGEMIELDAAQVLSIPRKIKATEVVKRGFMSNFLFQNIGGVFNAPAAVWTIIQQLPEQKDAGKGKTRVPTNENPIPPDVSGRNWDENGNPVVDAENILEKKDSLFGAKIYGTAIREAMESATRAMAETVSQSPDNKTIESETQKLLKVYASQVTEEIMKIASDEYGRRDLPTAKKKKIEQDLSETCSRELQRICEDSACAIAAAKDEAKALLGDNPSDEDRTIAEECLQEARNGVQKEFAERLSESVRLAAENAQKAVIEEVERSKANAVKTSVEDGVRDHLRGFARTIPEFLMAYGSDNTTLNNFEANIPPEEFEEITDITIDNFKFLRDGGDYTEGNETKHFAGHLFDEVVFNDAIKEFLDTKKKLANYFDTPADGEDIFSYIPPQRTNLIFTPKAVVVQMVDMLEKECPGCFDDPTHTFIDTYMKSGMYIAEVVKRLYQNPKMQALFPDADQRLQHIFANQVYGLAPTETIFRVACNFIMGFDTRGIITTHHLRCYDPTEDMADGTFNSKVDAIFDI